MEYGEIDPLSGVLSICGSDSLDYSYCTLHIQYNTTENYNSIFFISNVIFILIISLVSILFIDLWVRI